MSFSQHGDICFTVAKDCFTVFILSGSTSPE